MASEKPTTPEGWVTPLQRQRGEAQHCFYALDLQTGELKADDWDFDRATHLVHDARGCVRVCDYHLAWRAGLSIVEGHGETCPEMGVLAFPAPSTDP